jgi:CPA1 family monovalent cation:H+ antiporter
MNGFDISAVLLAAAAVYGYINRRYLRLPAASGTLLVALISSVLIIVADKQLPGLGLDRFVNGFLGRIDFNEALMRGMLSFLLFAGSLRVGLRWLLEQKWVVVSLATVGVALSTAIIGFMASWTSRAIGNPIPLIDCFIFGALISPTDPVAVLGLLKQLHAPRSLDALIAGESLFNDGVGVVAFFAVVSVAGLAVDTPRLTGAAGLGVFFVRQVVGGAALGLALGYVGFRMLRRVDDHPLELLITLALAMFIYSLSFGIGVSGPIAVVVAGLLIGNPGRRLAMSDNTREHVDAFWSMVDEVLNAVLFLLIGLELFAVPIDRSTAIAALLAIPIVLAARLVSVAVPVAVFGVRRRKVRLIPVLTWGGLRGGISVAMALSLPPFPARGWLLASTYAVVVFSILVQGLTMRPLLERCGVSAEAEAAVSE